MRTIASPHSDTAAMIERWVANGIITAEQAAQMRADLTATAATPVGAPSAGRGTSLVTEALGYLGGIIILVASGLVTGWYWSDMSTGVRLGLAGGVAALLLVAGAAVSRRLGPPGDRLRSVLWLLASAALAAFLALTADEILDWNDERGALLAGGGTAVVSAVLWYVHPRLLQHLATFVPLVVVVGTATSLLPSPGMLPGAGIWGLGAVWAVLAWGGVLRASRQGMILGAIAMDFGAMLVVGEDWGTPLALFTVVVLVLVAVAFRDLGLLVVASAGALFVLPATMTTYFPGVLTAALALLAVGILLVGAAIVTARRRREKPAESARDWSQGTPPVALAIAGVVAVATTAAILIGTG